MSRLLEEARREGISAIMQTALVIAYILFMSLLFFIANQNRGAEMQLIEAMRIYLLIVCGVLGVGACSVIIVFRISVNHTLMQMLKTPKGQRIISCSFGTFSYTERLIYGRRFEKKLKGLLPIVTEMVHARDEEDRNIREEKARKIREEEAEREEWRRKNRFPEYRDRDRISPMGWDTGDGSRDNE